MVVQMMTGQGGSLLGTHSGDLRGLDNEKDLGIQKPLGNVFPTDGGGISPQRQEQAQSL